MSRLIAPAESAWRRQVLFAAEVLDGVTLTRISAGISVNASALGQAPVLNAGGVFVWLDDGRPLAPQQVTVDPGLLPYQGASVASPVPPKRLVQIALAPARAYPFQAGTTALRFSLIESASGAPVAAAHAEVFLRWFDSGAWVDAPLRSRTDAHGDASVTLRFGRAEEPGKDGAGRLRVRLCAHRAGATTMSAEFALPEGRVTDIAPPFALNTFLP
ncbi:hypothetical protein [Massilia genomosp. 1]|uniref:Uncharacterized protein n=1 Tax=Massilia genomosp. 1 TaxID=2609280 RepID=A0ABX0MQE7_9BURK|nr:hypothetical protein [Massilia genomosp. 1]NHZ64601.1 hypothetical protein [Massilia genomosp. 1]